MLLLFMKMDISAWPLKDSQDEARFQKYRDPVNRNDPIIEEETGLSG